VGSPDDALQGWFKALPYKVKRDLAGRMREIAQGLADDIEDAAPELSGRLKRTVKVRRKRKELEFEVTAGGDETTKELRAGSGVTYDYALASEFGTAHQEAQPWFYSTYRAREADIREEIEDAVNDAISKT